MKKVLYLGCFLVMLTLIVFFISRQTNTQVFPICQDDATWEEKYKLAVIRLEDINPGAYNTRESLDKLEVMADYLYGEGVPFQVSLTPVYIDPGKNVEISIGDTDNPQVQDFIKTIKYMRSKGGVIGLHGCTHQMLYEITGDGFEFMSKGTIIYAQPSFADERARQALELMDKAGIPVDYWETPHYTAAFDQYRVLSKYFGLIYDPNPIDKKFKNTSSWDSTGPDNESTIFVPAPLLNIFGDRDVDRILSQLDKNEPQYLASFFFHPYQEFRSIYKMTAKEGYNFYVHETDSYLHRLISGFKERGYRFVSVYDLIDFLPAQRLSSLSSGEGSKLLTGDVDGDGRTDFITSDPASGRWIVVRSQIEQLMPRNNPRSFAQPEEWLNNWGQGSSRDFTVGDYNGDGKKDLVYREDSTGDIQVALSDGSKFILQGQSWGSFSESNGKAEVFAGCFNNDDKEDLLFWVQDENTAYVALSSGSGFAPAAVWLAGWHDIGGAQVFTGDFNGDGKKDLAALDKNSGAMRLALNTNSGFGAAADDYNQLSGFVTGDRWQVLSGDFTGDGIDDILACDSAMGKWEFLLSGETRFHRVSWPFVYGKDPVGIAMTGDFNGDKKYDLAAVRQFIDNQTLVDIAVSVINNKSASGDAVGRGN